MAKRKNNKLKEKVNRENKINQENKIESYSFEERLKKIESPLSIINFVITIVLTIVTIVISNKINGFTKNMSPLNYSFFIEPPETISFNTLEKYGVITGEENKYGDIPFTASECILTPLKNKLSGDYIRIMFAIYNESDFDIISYDQGNANSKYSFFEGTVLFLLNNTYNEISFLYSNADVLTNKEYDLLNVILQGYNGDYQIFSILCSLKNYDLMVVDNSNLHTISRYNEYIIKNDMTVKPKKLIEYVVNERKQLLTCLEE